MKSQQTSITSKSLINQTKKQPSKTEQKKQTQTQDIFQKRIYYNEKDYFPTKSKNLINKKCLIKSSDNIQIYDHAILHQKIILRADLAKIFIGRYVIINQSCIIKPPFKKQQNQIRHLPIEFGSFVYVDKGTIIQATKIGSYVKIGKQCIIGPRVVIGDCCFILDGAIVPADTQLASFSVYGGKPAMYMGQIPQAASIIQKQACTNYFDNFIQIHDQKKQLKQVGIKKTQLSTSSQSIKPPSSTVPEKK